MYNQKNVFRASIGGQALIEGVMMRGPDASAMAVRMPDGTISIDNWQTVPVTKWYEKAPFVRGIFHMAASLSVGYQCLMRSAQKAGKNTGKPSRFEKWAAKRFSTSIYTVASFMMFAIAIIFAIFLFNLLPTTIAGLISGYLPFEIHRSAPENIIKFCIFLLYLICVSKMREIQRVFEYHGAEHKTIACYEAGNSLSVENARRMSRFHPRCGTSFILIVLVVSMIVFSFISVENILLRVLLRIVMLPLVIGIAYETIKFFGRHNNRFVKCISLPGLWLQRLTTREPDDK